jgi:alpha-methylacyl-CoA racemase
MAMSLGYRAVGQFPDRTGAQLLGGGAHYYNVYETADGRHVAVGSIEPQFYRVLIERMGLDPVRFIPAGYPNLSRETVEHHWRELKEELAKVFRTRTRDEWVHVFDGTDACVTPVLSLSEAIDHPHNRARSAFIEVDGVLQQAPAPRFSGTPPATPIASTSSETTLAEVADAWR